MIGFQITSLMSQFFTLHDHYICFTRFILPSKNFNIIEKITEGCINTLFLIILLEQLV